MELPNNDVLLKVGAAAVAVWLVAAPYLPAIKTWVEKFVSNLSKPSPAQEVGTVADMKVILEMADRLRKAGNDKAVDACQELIDLMLHGEGK